MFIVIILIMLVHSY